ncbi:MAG: hypothetical protein ABSF71_00585 [Terriglobia bacterium]|jgi:hypothetical protein
MPLLPDRNRRHFLKAAAVAAGLTFDTLPLMAQAESSAPAKVRPASGGLPTGRIGKLEVTRLICGGNLFSGFAHSGELLYVHSLLQHYFTDDKILDTLQLCEESGINTTILRTDEQIIRILKRYRQERGGTIQWIAQTYPAPDNLKDNIKLAIDNGAVGAYCMGGVADDTFVKAGKAELIGEIVSFIKQNGLVAGVGSHSMETAIISEQQRFNPDFYFKTLNPVGFYTQDPRDVAALMKTIKKPWIAFKVLGAGRVLPQDGFDLAFKNGADFINVGMYDFQVAPNTSLVREVVKRHEQRDRTWA